MSPKHLADRINRQASIIVFTQNLQNPLDFYDFVYKFIALNDKQYFKEVKLNDQFLFSLYLFEKALKIYELDDRYNGTISWRKTKEASIVHAWGQHNRFWNNKLCALAWNEWWVYYKKWLELGGSTYEGGFKAKLEVPEAGGDLFGYFERIAWAKRISELKEFEFIIEIDFASKVKFKSTKGGENFSFALYSKSIHTFILECFYKDKLQESKTIARKDLESSLREFILSSTTQLEREEKE